MKLYRILLLFAISAVFLGGCEQEDYTGHSVLSPTNPTISVDFGTVTSVSDGVDHEIPVLVTMDVAQIVDVRVYILVNGGSASVDDDYTVPEYVQIPAGRTSASFTVTVLADEVAESTENFTIQVGDDRTANAAIVPVTQTYTINNFTSDDLAVEMSWSVSGDPVYDVAGEEISATDIADMILSVYDEAGNLVDQADGGSFESLEFLSADYPDGKYLLTVSFYGAMDFGDQGGVDLDFAFDFSQLGVQAKTLEFEKLLNTASDLSEELYTAELVKTGSSWTVSKFVYDLDFVFGTYSVDAASYGSPGAWDEFWANVTIEKFEGTLNKVLISGIADSDVAIVASVNPIANTMAIAPGQSLGDVESYGFEIAVYNAMGGSINASIDRATGEITADYWQHLISAGSYAGYEWDTFYCTFTKTSKLGVSEIPSDKKPF